MGSFHWMVDAERGTIWQFTKKWLCNQKSLFTAFVYRRTMCARWTFSDNNQFAEFTQHTHAQRSLIRLNICGNDNCFCRKKNHIHLQSKPKILKIVKKKKVGWRYEPRNEYVFVRMIETICGKKIMWPKRKPNWTIFFSSSLCSRKLMKTNLCFSQFAWANAEQSHFCATLFWISIQKEKKNLYKFFSGNWQLYKIYLEL